MRLATGKQYLDERDEWREKEEECDNEGWLVTMNPEMFCKNSKAPSSDSTAQ